MRGLIACTMNALEVLGAPRGKLSCWLHVEDRVKPDVRPLVLKLLGLNCCHFAVSGDDAMAVHDQIDDILIELESELVLTTWHTGSLPETARGFLAVECAGGVDPIRLVMVFASSEQRELIGLSEAIDALCKELE